MDNPAATFVLKQKLVSMGGDAWIEDVQGNRVFEVDGKALALRRTLKLNDTAGNEIYHIGKSLMHLRKTFEIKKGEQIVATIQQGLVSFLGDKFKINGDAVEEIALDDEGEGARASVVGIGGGNRGRGYSSPGVGK